MLPPEYAPARPPFNHQLEALERGWDRAGFAYLMEMGTGKTRTAIDNGCLLHARGLIDAILIFAPKSVYTNWTRQDRENPGELQQWLWPQTQENLLMYTWRSGRSQKESALQARLLAAEPGLRVLAVNSEALSSVEAARILVQRFARAHRVLAIVDESTLMKNPHSKVTKFLLRMAPHFSHRRILSGQPMTNSPVDLFPQFEFVLPGGAPLGTDSLVAFRSRYTIMEQIEVAGRPVNIEVGTQNMAELSERMQPHSFRKRKVECLDLPPKLYMSPRDVPMTDEQRRIYRELRTVAMSEIRPGAETTTQHVATLLLRLHQVVCGHIRTDDGIVRTIPTRRIDTMMESVEEAGDQQMIIWSRFLPDISGIVRALEAHRGPGCCALWHGEVTQPNREAGENAFQRGDKRFMVATQAAGARGRTWTAASAVLYYSNTHDVELRTQSEDRAHRIGQTSRVGYQDLVAEGTVDEGIRKALREQRDLVATVLRDGPSGWI